MYTAFQKSIHVQFFLLSVATIAFDRDEIRVSEGNSTTNMTLDLNVVITRLPVGGLQREVIAAISVYELSATGTTCRACD